MSILLFVYGTLHPDRAPRGIVSTARRLKPVDAATIRGRLLDLGDYPGLQIREPGDPEACDIAGTVFEVPDPVTLGALDAYEGFSPEKPAASLFRRVQADVSLGSGSQLRCWVYVYNR